jgi:predicted membrane-bound spermidine synthase
MKHFKKYSLEVITFVSGALVMIIELVGSRIVAPYLGTSIFVWTSLIGVMLASLSLGYYAGGRLSDKNPQPKILSRIILGAAICSSLVLILEPLLSSIAKFPFDIRLSTTLASLMLFAPVTFLLGMITPYVARLKITTVASAGTTIGTLYALSTVGSISGTFLGGFILISFLGTKAIFALTTLVLFVLYIYSLILHHDFKKPINFLMTFVFLVVSAFSLFSFGLSGRAFADIDSHYNRWLVYDTYERTTKRPVRYLMNNVSGVQSAVYPANPKELVFSYLKVFDVVANIQPHWKSSLLIGAGAYTYPTHIMADSSDKRMDVVEIDEKLHDIAKKYFGFKDTSRIRMIEKDGRAFLNTNKKKYDLIFVDAFSSQLSIPYHLTSIEAATALRNSLQDKGIAAVNIISAIDGPASSFLKAEYNTYKRVFPRVEVIRANPAMALSEPQNLILVAFESNKEPDATLQNLVLQSELTSSEPMLTDDFAPVEKFTAEMLKARSY